MVFCVGGEIEKVEMIGELKGTGSRAAGEIDAVNHGAVDALGVHVIADGDLVGWGTGEGDALDDVIIATGGALGAKRDGRVAQGGGFGGGVGLEGPSRRRSAFERGADGGKIGLGERGEVGIGRFAAGADDSQRFFDIGFGEHGDADPGFILIAIGDGQDAVIAEGFDEIVAAIFLALGNGGRSTCRFRGQGRCWNSGENRRSPKYSNFCSGLLHRSSRAASAM